MKVTVEYALNQLYKIWLMALIITVGIVVGMIILPDTRETGWIFLFFTLTMCLYQMGLTFHFYEYDLKEESKEDEQLVDKSKSEG